MQTKFFFLTYARCDLTCKQLLDNLEKHGRIDKYRIVVEEHANDHGRHLHAAVVFETKKRIRRADYFDIGDYHPHIERLIDRRTGNKEYFSKDPIEEMSNWEIADTRLAEVRHAIADGKESEFEYKLRHPHSAKVFDQIVTYYETMTMAPLGGFYFPWWAEAKAIMNNLLYINEAGVCYDSKALFICGPSGCGKSTFVEECCEHWVKLSHPKTVSLFVQKHHKILVWDEFDPKIWSTSRLKDMINGKRCASDPYYGSVMLPWPRICIFIYNDPGLPIEWTGNAFGALGDTALIRRVVILNLFEKTNEELIIQFP